MTVYRNRFGGLLISDSTSVGEEGHVEGSKVQLEDDFTWIVDPIDGEPSARKVYH